MLRVNHLPTGCIKQCECDLVDFSTLNTFWVCAIFFNNGTLIKLTFCSQAIVKQTIKNGNAGFCSCASSQSKESVLTFYQPKQVQLV